MRPKASPCELPSSSGGYFTQLRIDQTELLQQSYRLRYEVYCMERGFLPPQDYPDQSETDDYDAYSMHFGVLDRAQQLAGTVRLIPASEGPLPLHEHCKIDLPKIPDNTAEISRLAVSKGYRRRVDDNLYGFSLTSAYTHPNDAQRRRRPEIVLGLYKIMYQESKRSGTRYWLAAMEKSLVRLLCRFQFEFTQVGPDVDYYGTVAPFFADINCIEEKVRRKNPQLYAEFNQGLEAAYIKD